MEDLPEYYGERKYGQLTAKISRFCCTEILKIVCPRIWPKHCQNRQNLLHQNIEIICSNIITSAHLSISRIVINSHMKTSQMPPMHKTIRELTLIASSSPTPPPGLSRGSLTPVDHGIGKSLNNNTPFVNGSYREWRSFSRCRLVDA